MSERQRVLIMGAGGRDFHVFNTLYRSDETVEVVAFTAAQIPHIDDRRYPPVLSGPLYPRGIPIEPEEELEHWIEELEVDEVVFAYSDVSLELVDRERRRVEATGARFSTFDPERTLIDSARPTVAVCAVRTGCGKSQVARHLATALRSAGKRVGVLRHPMPYGELERQVVQRFAEIDDLERHHCTIEEMEEYEPHIRAGGSVFAGADYSVILAAAEHSSDVIIWDGGNNDAPFVRPDLLITLLDPLRPGDELRYFPSRYNLESADILLVVKSGHATPEGVAEVERNARRYNPDALVLRGRSPIALEDDDLVRGRRVLVVEDGPTTTHGGMGYGAGLLAARAAGAAEIVDPRPYALGEIAQAFEHFPHLERVLPALGYGDRQIAELQATIERVDCDAVVIGTPIDLRRIIDIRQPTVRASYSWEDAGEPGLAELVIERLFPDGTGEGPAAC